MRWSYASAGPGVVALIGELAAGTGLLALGFGDSEAAARGSCQASLAAGYDATAAAFRPGWQAWTARTAASPAPAGRSLPAGVPAAVRQSAAVLRTHADHAAVGAYVAGLAIPWGEDTNDPGGYHLVWCRDAGESALALAAAGHVDDAVAVLGYLLAHQSLDGSWPRCAYVDGSAMPGAVQLDEVAFPVLLDGQLAELATALPAGADAAIRRAATYLAQQGPVSDRDVDRWEENPGASPFTLGLEIVAMVVAAGHLTGADRDLALALADSWNERLEEFTYHAGSDLDREFGTSGHYVRIGLPGGDRVGVGNQPGGPLSIELRPPPWSAWSSSTCRGWTCGTHTTPVSPTRWPSSKRCSVAVRRMAPPTTATTSTGTASGSTAAAGRGGTSASAAPGRCSPANAATTTYSPVATAAPSSRRCSECGAGAVCSPSRSGTPTHCPWRQLRNGQPSGSAMPLAWAHSKLIKLAVTAATGRPVEMLRQVSDRYAAKVPTAAHRIADRRRCLEASLAHGGGAAPGRQVSPQLPQEERVATGLVAQDGGPPPGAVRRHASLPDEELRNVLGVQAGKVKPAYAVESVEVRDGVHQAGGALRGGGPVRGEHQDPGICRALDDVAEQLQRRGAGPVHILKCQDQRALIGGRHDGNGGRVVELPPVLALGLSCLARFTSTHQGSQAVDKPLQGGTCGIRPGSSRDGQLPVYKPGQQCHGGFDVRLVRCSEVRHARPEQHRGTVPVQRGRCLREQARLARARFSADEHQLASTVGDCRPHLVQRGQLPPSTDEDGPPGTRPAGGQRWRCPAGHDPTLVPGTAAGRGLRRRHDDAGTGSQPLI